MSDRRSFSPAPRPDVGTRMKRELLAGVAALGIFGATEGCAANYRPTPATPDRYAIATHGFSDAREGRFTEDQIAVWKHWFRIYSRDAAHVSPEQRAAVDRRVDEITGRNEVREAETTLDGTGIERAWQRSTSSDVFWSSYVRESRHYDNEWAQQEGMRWRSRDYEDWMRLIRAFEEHSDAVHQVHITRESVGEILRLDGAPDSGTNNNADHTNITDRFSEQVGRYEFSSLLPPSSGRLGFERREEQVRAVGRGTNAEASRIRAMADFIGRMENKMIVLNEEADYFVNDRTISQLSIARQSGAFYVRNVEFVTTQAPNPETGVLESQTVMTAEVLYAAPPAGSQLAQDRVVRRPLFRDR